MLSTLGVTFAALSLEKNWPYARPLFSSPGVDATSRGRRRKWAPSLLFYSPHTAAVDQLNSESAHIRGLRFYIPGSDIL